MHHAQEFTVTIDNSQPITLQSDIAGEMLLFYYPKAFKHLVQKCMKRAKTDHRIELDKQFRVVFKNGKK